jgi:hypothetical protein
MPDGRSHVSAKGFHGMPEFNAPHVLQAAGISIRFEPDCGMLCGLSVNDGGREIRPMHRVPWIGEDMPDGAPRHLARMEGDFFCAPFGNGGGTAPVLHGWPANGTWIVTDLADDRSSLAATLDKDVQGARLTKHLRLIDGHPFIYQSHVFEGGNGEISAANHAMVSLPAGGLVSMSPKTVVATPSIALEPDPKRGRSALAYPAESNDPRRFPASDGTMLDLGTYPWRERHEDFAIAIERPGHALGWTAVVRLGDASLFLSLRNATRLPMTMMWHSDGGRNYAPWSGRHRYCLGIEEGFAPHMLGKAGGFVLGGNLVVRHVIGALGWPSEERVVSVHERDQSLVITGVAGAQREVPFDPRHLM